MQLHFPAFVRETIKEIEYTVFQKITVVTTPGSCIRSSSAHFGFNEGVSVKKVREGRVEEICDVESGAVKCEFISNYSFIQRDYRRRGLHGSRAARGDHLPRGYVDSPDRNICGNDAESGCVLDTCGDNAGVITIPRRVFRTLRNSPSECFFLKLFRKAGLWPLKAFPRRFDEVFMQR